MNINPSPPSSVRTLSTRRPSLDLSCLNGNTHPTEVEPSNTLLITNLPQELFEEETLALFRQNLSKDVNILHWAPIRSFSRLVCVTESIDEAIEIRRALDGLIILERRVKVYFGEHTKEVDLKDAHLHPPEFDKNFLVSPPGSVPVEWETTREGPPNTCILPEELTLALEKLASQTISASRPVTCHEFESVTPPPHQSKHVASASSEQGTFASLSQGGKRARSSTITLLEKGQQGNEGPGITVDDYDGDGMETHQRLGAIRGTALPPLA